jgi:hypothetical protein
MIEYISLPETIVNAIELCLPHRFFPLLTASKCDAALLFEDIVNTPWHLVKAKTASAREINPALAHFQHQTGARYAFQAACQLPYVARSCFGVHTPMIVPAATFFSQLV